MTPEFPGGFPVIFDDWIPYIPVAQRFKVFENGAWHVAPASPLALRILVESLSGDKYPCADSLSVCPALGIDHLPEELAHAGRTHPTEGSASHISDLSMSLP